MLVESFGMQKKHGKYKWEERRWRVNSRNGKLFLNLRLIRPF